MPVGNPSKQTIANRKYQNKAGYVSKSYKLKRDVVEEFAEACEKDGVSQAAMLTKLMKSYCESKKMA